MAITNVNLSDTMSVFVTKTNTISNDVGNVDNLVTGDSNVVDAINTVRNIVSAFDDSGELTTISRQSISVDDQATGVSLSYNSGSGIFTLTGSVDAQSTRSLFSSGNGLNYDSITGEFTIGNYVAVGATSGNGISGSVSSNGGTFTVTSNATADNTANTIVFRDDSSNFSANIITATATQAQYADVAEKYTTETIQPPGTVMTIGTNKDDEMEPWTSGKEVTGVISTNPAYIMNSSSEGQSVALVGRVPVRIKGTVAKGDVVYACSPGLASVTGTGPMVGIALQSNNFEEVKIVECYLKF